jgi:hypothetical protein
MEVAVQLFPVNVVLKTKFALMQFIIIEIGLVPEDVEFILVHVLFAMVPLPTLISVMAEPFVEIKEQLTIKKYAEEFTIEIASTSIALIWRFCSTYGSPQLPDPFTHGQFVQFCVRLLPLMAIGVAKRAF